MNFETVVAAASRQKARCSARIFAKSSCLNTRADSRLKCAAMSGFAIWILDLFNYFGVLVSACAYKHAINLLN